MEVIWNQRIIARAAVAVVVAVVAEEVDPIGKLACVIFFLVHVCGNGCSTDYA
jgi:hypothetical protein